MFIREDDLKLNDWQFSQRKYLDYEMKLRLTKSRIREWNDNWSGNVYVSFSGGLDSTVLLHLVREVIGDMIPAVFCNTGLEYPEIVAFARRARYNGEFQEIRPNMNFKKVILDYGYPIVSKETAAKIRKLRNGDLSPKYRNYLLNGDERGSYGKLADKWKFLLNAPFETSEKCCDIMKKKPFDSYEKVTKRVPYIGITQDESFQRSRLYAKTGCNVYAEKKAKSQPLGFWTKQDILRYIVENSVEYCPIYGSIQVNSKNKLYLAGEQRSGCMFCAFGAHLEDSPNRFQRMHESHINQYEFCMKNVEEGGLGLKKILNYSGIKVEPQKVILRTFNNREIFLEVSGYRHYIDDLVMYYIFYSGAWHYVKEQDILLNVPSEELITI